MKKMILFLACCFLAFTLAGCKSGDYKKAAQFQEEGDYLSAIALYEELGEYEDAIERLKICKTEQEKIEKYAEASELLGEKEYEKAKALFVELGAYQNSSEKLKECETMISAINEFEEAVSHLEAENEKLDTMITDGNRILEEAKPALDEELYPAFESIVSDVKSVKVSVPSMPESADEIHTVAEKIAAIHYDEKLEALAKAQDALEKSIRQYALVDNPDEGYVISCLQKVENILDISAATEENDPNGQLHKAGGYNAQVYFTCALVDQSSVEGTTVIEKGTNGGGSIEVYSTSEEARSRETYLAGFDGTIFATGSHKIIGTCLIRTSDKLTASQQTVLEEAIIAQLIYVE